MITETIPTPTPCQQCGLSEPTTVCRLCKTDKRAKEYRPALETICPSCGGKHVGFSCRLNACNEGDYR